MIVSLQGLLESATPLGAVVNVHGVGYEVHVPITTAERLPAVGQPVKLHTVAIYREDTQALYGFATIEERDFFRLLIGHVSGVGPRVALTIMSRLSLPILRAAILNGDVGLLAQCHGIGKKTAERLVGGLKDKLGPSPVASGEGGGVVVPAASGGAPAADSRETRLRDAVLALMQLGYKLPDAEKVVRRIASAGGNEELTTEQLIKRALAGS